jgi:DNA-binding response OmpR family regulator
MIIHMNYIAVVDDEKSIRELIRMALEKENLRSVEFKDGLEAWEGFKKEAPDLIILDILMPRMDGLELCRKIRTLSGEGASWGAAVPIIFLSSRDEEIDKVLGLESGADDYVSKPFSLRELVARIRAALRRKETRPGDAAPFTPPLVLGKLLLDENRALAFWNGEPIELTVTELRILKSLCSRPGLIKTREQIMSAAFPEDTFPNDRAADSHIKRIRRKFLERDPAFDALEAVYGLGYRWQEAVYGPGYRRQEAAEAGTPRRDPGSEKLSGLPSGTAQ